MKMGSSRLWTCVALALVTAFAAGSADAGVFDFFRSKKKRTVPVVRRSLVVFPFDHGSMTNAPGNFGELMASDIRSMLADNPIYAVFLFRGRLAPIERAVSEADSTIKRPDTEGPFSDDKAKALRLARALASDLYMVGVVDDYAVDVAKKVAQMTVRADLYDTKTGKLVKTLLVSARSPETSKPVDDQELRDLAKGAAITRLVAELTAPEQAEEPVAPAAPDASAPGSAEKAVEKPAEKPTH